MADSHNGIIKGEEDIPLVKLRAKAALVGGRGAPTHTVCSHPPPVAQGQAHAGPPEAS